MKKHFPRYYLFAFVLLFFTSCFDITEEFTVNDDGAGSYSMKLDMYKMVEMLAGMGGKDADMSQNKEFNEIKDTTVFFKNDIDTAYNLTPEEKALFRDGNAHVKMHLAEKEMYFNFNFPFKKSADLQEVYDKAPKAMAHIKMDLKDDKEEMDTSEKGKKKSKKNKDEEMEDLIKPGIDPNKMATGPTNDAAKLNAYFKIQTGKGFFEKTVNEAELKNYLATDTTLLKMMPMMSSVYVYTIVHLPRPAKTVSHPYAKLSEDRKTVTLKFPFSDYSERPEVLNFRIEY
ncbi:hypothetical protein BH11BAC2_BH11BAC2_17810 [soil metagenome]